MATILLEGIHKSFPTPRGKFSLEDINLVIPDGKTTMLIGPTGCGKTTLLRIIAGLESPDAGIVRYDSVDMSNVPIRERRIGMVFQNYALYPHLSAVGNILSWFIFSKRVARIEDVSPEKLQRASELLQIDIAYLQGRSPRHLSQGERQRVALGRAITREPLVLLLDEPLSNLDAKLRTFYRLQIKRLIQELKVTTVYITHNQQEALTMGDWIAVMNNGRIEQRGAYLQIYNNPKNAFVAGFLGLYPDLSAINLIDGAAIPGESVHTLIGVRPEDLEISLSPREGYDLQARVTQVNLNPAQKYDILTLDLEGEEISAMVEHGARIDTGQPIWLRFAKTHKFTK